MRSADSATVAAVQSRAGIIRRNLVWIVAKNRDTGAPESTGLWNELDPVTITVVSADSGEDEARTYHGAGGLLQVERVPLVADLSIRTIRISLSQISEAVQQAIRGYDPRLAHVELHRAFFDPATRAIVAKPLPRFVGRLNKAPINTPATGGEGGIAIEVVSHTRELTRTNPAKKSDETQQLRGDRFRRYAGTAGQWDQFWGETKGRAG